MLRYIEYSALIDVKSGFLDLAGFCYNSESNGLRTASFKDLDLNKKIQIQPCWDTYPYNGFRL
jgi:hypothetical protein